MDKRVNKGDLIRHRATRVRYLVLMALCLAAGLAYVHRGCYGVAESTISRELSLSPHQSGQIMSIFFWSYAIFQIPTGVLVDRWGPRRSLFLFGMMGAITLAISAGTMFVSGMVAFWLLFISRMLMGVAQAGLFPASTKCISIWFPVRQRGLGTGILQACMSLGGAGGAFLTAAVLAGVAWPWMFLIFAVPGVVWSFWFYAWYRESPKEHPGTNNQERELIESDKPPPKTPREGKTPWLRLFLDSKLIWISVQQFFRAAANVFWLTWCPTYLQRVFSLDKTQAGQLTSIPFAGVIIGSLCGGLIADWIYRRTGSKVLSRKGLAIVASLIGVSFFVVAGMEEGSSFSAVAGVSFFAKPRPIPTEAFVTVGLLFVAAVFCAMPNPCAYAVTIDTGGRYPAVVFGSMNMMGNFGAALFPLLVPFWVGEWSWASLPYFLGGLYFVGMLCWLFLNVRGEVMERHG